MDVDIGIQDTLSQLLSYLCIQWMSNINILLVTILILNLTGWHRDEESLFSVDNLDIMYDEYIVDCDSCCTNNSALAVIFSLELSYSNVRNV